MNNIPRTIPSGTNCQDYIIGNFRRKEALAARVQKTKNLIEQADCAVNEISIKECCYAVILTDLNSDLIWENGLKTKDQILAAPKKSHSDTAPLRQKSKLITFMRDNAGENRSDEIEEYMQSKDGGGD